jgi:hypothetical protein
MIARNEAGQVEGMHDLGHGVVFTFASSSSLMSHVCSTPLRNAGTTFKIYLPRHRTAISQEAVGPRKMVDSVLQSIALYHEKSKVV